MIIIAFQPLGLVDSSYSYRLLDRNNQQEYDAFKQAYANVLDRWNLVNQKTQILKYIHKPTTPHSGLSKSLHFCHS